MQRYPNGIHRSAIINQNSSSSRESLIATIALALFVFLYVALLSTLSPLLYSNTPLAAAPSIINTDHLESAQFVDQDLNDAFLKTQREFDGAVFLDELIKKQKLRSSNKDNNTSKEKNKIDSNNSSNNEILVQNYDKKVSKPREGFMVLGMHRSGTSMLGGLLVKGLGYNVGPDHALIQPNFDNKKGFFERVDAVLQNDEFMKEQGVWYGGNCIKYDADRALKAKEDGKITFKEGTRALKFLNNSSNKPWMQKDPRMCITLRTWLPLLNAEPAVVFSYRHPLEVAKSMEKRDGSQAFPLYKGLRLWIVYNMRAIQNSSDLCRVMTNNVALMTDTQNEVKRIGDGLVKCGLAPPKQVTEEAVLDFVDPSLRLDSSKHFKDDILEEYKGVKIYDYNSSTEEGSLLDMEHNLYVKAMKIYIDFENGDAYQPSYQWPELN